MNPMPLFQPSGPPAPRPPLRPLHPIHRRPSIIEKLLERALAELSPDQRAGFEERVAICIHDAGLSETEAIRVAASDLARREQAQEQTW